MGIENEAQAVRVTPWLPYQLKTEAWFSEFGVYFKPVSQADLNNTQLAFDWSYKNAFRPADNMANNNFTMQFDSRLATYITGVTVKLGVSSANMINLLKLIGGPEGAWVTRLSTLSTSSNPQYISGRVMSPVYLSANATGSYVQLSKPIGQVLDEIGKYNIPNDPLKFNTFYGYKDGATRLPYYVAGSYSSGSIITSYMAN